MNFKIISIGKFGKNCPYLTIFERYKKMIPSRVEFIEIKNINLDIEKKIVFEKNQIIKNIKDQNEVIVLDGKGKNISSLELASLFEKKRMERCKEITFVIGGAYGLDKTFFKDFKSISFGKQTWPHLLIRVMLMEQIYRALSLITSHPYHK